MRYRAEQKAPLRIVSGVQSFNILFFPEIAPGIKPQEGSQPNTTVGQQGDDSLPDQAPEGPPDRFNRGHAGKSGTQKQHDARQDQTGQTQHNTGKPLGKPPD